MKYISMILTLSYIVLFITSCCDCKDKENEKKPVIVGLMTWHEWQNAAGWKDYNAESYNPSNQKISEIKKLLKENKELSFKIFAGSWCSDSEKGLPKFMKLLNLCVFDSAKTLIIGLNKDMKDLQGAAKPYKIEKVPTIIVLNNGVEIGRIVESPILSWEDDLETLLEEK